MSKFLKWPQCQLSLKKIPAIVIAVYMLSFTLAKPVSAQDEEVVGGLLALLGGSIVLYLLFLGAIIGAYIWMLVWVNRDAKMRGQSGCMPMLLVLFFGPLGLIVWLLMRPQD